MAESAPAESYPEFGRTPGKTCRDQGLARFLGKSLNEALVADARAASGAAVVRVVRPGDIVTMDLRYDRLNIDLDKAGKVTRLKCG